MGQQLGLRKQQGTKVIREKRKVPVEVDGGVWTGGRHINPAGYINDMEKLNTAASMGWLVLRITTDDRFASKTYDLIKAVVEYRINES